jgi:hypothetical protein
MAGIQTPETQPGSVMSGSRASMVITAPAFKQDALVHLDPPLPMEGLILQLFGIISQDAFGSRPRQKQGICSRT